MTTPHEETKPAKFIIGGLLLTVIGASLFGLFFYFDARFQYSEYPLELAVIGIFGCVPIGVFLFSAGIYKLFSKGNARKIEGVSGDVPDNVEYNKKSVPLGAKVKFFDDEGRQLQYPYLVFPPPQKPSNTLFWLTVLLVAVLTMVYYLFSHEDEFSNILLGVVLLGVLPATIGLFIFKGVIPHQYRSSALVALRLEPCQQSFCEVVGKVIQTLQGGTLEQATSSAHLCMEDQRIQLIDKIFDDKNITLSIRLKINYQKTEHEMAFDVVRGMRLMKPLDREALRSVLHLYNMGRINDEKYRYFVGAILAGDEEGTIDNYQEKTPLRTSQMNKSLMYPDLKTMSSFAFKLIKNELGWRYEEAQSDVMICIDELKAEYPDEQTINTVYDTMHYGGKWFSRFQIPGSIYDNQKNDRYVLSLGSLDDGTPLTFSKDGSLMTVGGAGSGKTQSLVIPNLLTWQGSAIVLDVKPELWDKTAGYREKNFGSVFKLDLRGRSKHSFNPFEFVSGDPNHIFADSFFFSNLIVPPSLGAGGNQKFWEDSARNILQICIIAMVLEYHEGKKNPLEQDRPPKPTLAGLIRMVSGRSDLDQALYTLENSGIDQCQFLSRMVTSNLIDPEKKGSSVLPNIINQLLSQIQPLINPAITDVTKTCDWTPDDLRQNNSTLYIVLKPGQVQEYAALLRLVLGIHLREYLALEDGEAKKRAPILLMFDEMPQLGYMEVIEQAIDTGRSKGIKLWGFVQRLGQLKNQYPDALGLLGNCKVQMYLSPTTEDGTAQLVSEALGIRQDFADGGRIPLADASALGGAEFSDKTIVTGQGTTPAKVSREMAYLNDEYGERMNIPPPE